MCVAVTNNVRLVRRQFADIAVEFAFDGLTFRLMSH
jgi:hypothetical protein